MKKLLPLLLAAAFSLVGCDSYDDSAVWDSISSIEKRLSAVETVVKAYENNLFIESVTETDNGYLIVFSDGSKAEIADGKDGKPGSDGKGGDTFIENIELGDDSVTFTLTDGRTFSIPLHSALSIAFDSEDLVVMSPNSIRNIGYSIDNPSGEIKIEVISSADIKAKVVAEIPTFEAGYIEVSTSDRIDEYSKVVVLVTDGRQVMMRTIKFEEEGLQIWDTNHINVDATGGVVNVEYFTNVECEISIPDDVTWIHSVDTKAMDYAKVALSVDENTGQTRSANVIIFSQSGLSLAYTIYQIGVGNINIPDAEFKRQLVSEYDTDNDGEISCAEAAEVTEMEVITDNVLSIDGIGYFTNLRKLALHPSGYRWGTGIGEDWRNSGYYSSENINNLHTKIVGKITELDLSKNVLLQSLDCSGNDLKTLDLSQNSELQHVEVTCNIDLTEIKFAADNKIEYLDADATSICRFDARYLGGLRTLRASRAKEMSTIDLSSFGDLTVLDVSGRNLNHLDVSKNSNLSDLGCSMNNLSELNLSENINLTSVNFAFNNISSIDFSNNRNLREVYLHNNRISTLDISMLEQLERINFGNYQKASDGSITVNTISEIDLSHNGNLIDLSGSLLELRQVDISGNKQLERVHLTGNQLTALDVSNNLKITELHTSLNPDLKTIYISPEQDFLYEKDEWTSFAFLSEVDLYESQDYSADGIVNELRKATVGDGIDMVLMGDGFSDRLIADGSFRQKMQEAMDGLFSIEPYKSYKEMFNVYCVNSVSRHEEFRLGSETVFSGYFSGGTAIKGKDDVVFQYAQKALTEEEINEALIIVVLNNPVYAGTCYMYYPEGGDFGNGPAIAYVPMGTNAEEFVQLIHHEAAGHGFAKLADEYAYEEQGTISKEAMDEVNMMDAYGWYRNVDFTSDPSAVKWSHFLSDERYANDGLGVFEGGYTYWTGVWRPTEDSIMRYNVGDFNAPSREAIYYRIHKLAFGDSWEYNYEDFVEYDAINRAGSPAEAAAKRARRNYVEKQREPLAPPVIVGKTWREAMGDN